MQSEKKCLSFSLCEWFSNFLTRKHLLCIKQIRLGVLLDLLKQTIFANYRALIRLHKRHWIPLPLYNRWWSMIKSWLLQNGNEIKKQFGVWLKMQKKAMTTKVNENQMNRWRRCLIHLFTCFHILFSIFNNTIIGSHNNGWNEQQHNAERLLKLIEEIYRWLPLGTIVNNRVFVVHGGISDTTDLDLLKSLDRGKVSTFSFLFIFLFFCYFSSLSSSRMLLIPMLDNSSWIQEENRVFVKFVVVNKNEGASI